MFSLIKQRSRYSILKRDKASIAQSPAIIIESPKSIRRYSLVHLSDLRTASVKNRTESGNGATQFTSLSTRRSVKENYFLDNVNRLIIFIRLQDEYC